MVSGFMGFFLELLALALGLLASTRLNHQVAGLAKRLEHYPSETSPKLDLENLRALKVLGKGAMGTIFLVHDTLSNPSARLLFALKVVEKSALCSKLNAKRHARWEIQVLTRLSNLNPHPFLPSIIGSFESDEFMG
ncbi:hypothetical protein DVH24_007975 [Malus domestica]|uniref:non-specific serine/threonine protein kinase n=1 Tax=Malus domestica TaxID=3750 RepID=A0A498JKC9_MALDO|nr:hypothetical protein DVH24_007975 [Malus domestica]